MSQTITLRDIITGTKVHYNKRHLKDISLFDLDLRSRSQLKVKGHRRGGVCVLWIFLVCIFVCLSYDGIHARFVFIMTLSIVIISLKRGYCRKYSISLFECISKLEIQCFNKGWCCTVYTLNKKYIFLA